jgi:arylsulfatase A-like enzyme
MKRRRPPQKTAKEKAPEKSRLTIFSAAGGAIAGAAVWKYLAVSSLSFAPAAFHWTLCSILVAGSGLISLGASFLARRFLTSRLLSWSVSITLTLLLVLLYLLTFLARDANVLLIVSDATRADHLHCNGYGKETTSNLDGLAKEGILFRHAIAQGSHTIVATPSIICSIYPSQHGLTTYSDVLSDSVRTLAEILRDAGYTTFGVSTNPHLTKQTGFAQGFETYDSDRSWLNTDASKVVDRFLSWLEENSEKRFFAFLFFIDPHSPYEPPAEFLEKFGGDPGFLVKDWNLDSLRIYPPEGRRQIIARYDGEIAFFDHELGRLLSGLVRKGVFEKTLIVYTSDHGEAFWEHGRVGHGDSLYEELLRIPLLMKLPSLFTFPRLAAPTGATIEEPVAQVDVMPTVLQFFGVDIPAQAQGISLLPCLYRGECPEERTIFSEEILLQLGPYNMRSVRDGRWKFVLDQDMRGGVVRRELYDLESDPKEEVNLISRKTEVAKELERELVVFMGRMERMRIVSGKHINPTESMLESLKALGYIE